MTPSQLIKALRNAGFTRRELAEECGRSKSSIRRYERGDTMPEAVRECLEKLLETKRPEPDQDEPKGRPLLDTVETIAQRIGDIVTLQGFANVYGRIRRAYADGRVTPAEMTGILIAIARQAKKYFEAHPTTPDAEIPDVASVFEHPVAGEPTPSQIDEALAGA